MTAHAYIHVPFCARRCTYCDFSIAVRTITPVDEYLHAFRLELYAYRFAGWQLDTLYFGGGTPSRLGGSGIADAISSVRDIATFNPGAEITIEANPDDITPSNAAHWHAAGVNRVSLGVQSFDPDVLAWMHRTHTVDQSVVAINTLRDAGITNLSVDLIFALPPSLDRDWHRDVDHILALNPDHVSLYGLTIEPNTPLARLRDRGDVSEAHEDRYAHDYLHAHSAMTAAGLEHYEVSNYGRPGRHSRHNSTYWTGASYAGLGPSAHAFDGETRSWNVAAYREWADRLTRGQSPLAGSETLDDTNRSAERVYLGLRTRTGLRATETERAFVRPWVDAGWAIVTETGTIVLTAEGWLRLDSLAASLTLADRR